MGFPAVRLPDHRVFRLGIVRAVALGSALACAPALALPELGGVAKVATGAYHTCALTNSAAVKCWGDNATGQLGLGDTRDRLAATDVPGLSGGVIAIAAGARHTCALTSTGGAKCWGYNIYGQVGDGNSGTYVLAPVDVQGLASGVAAISAGSYHSCALTTAGAVRCWGRNDYGQLGDGTHSQRTTPVAVTGLAAGVAAISASRDFTCVLTTAGGAKCWGRNDSGQLGDGTYDARATPVDVSGLSGGLDAIETGGYHACALTASGAMTCWGSDAYGELGDGNSPRDTRVPGVVPSLGSGVASIAAGIRLTCAVTKAGGAKCWGTDDEGQLGDGGPAVPIFSPDPVDVVGLSSGVRQVDVGNFHACAVLASGGVRCWGRAEEGQLGNRGALIAGEVYEVPYVYDATAVAAGWVHTCALTAAGGVKCWGWNDDGQLGDGTFVSRFQPADVLGLPGPAVAIATGREHTCALLASGAILCWGRPGDGMPIRNRPQGATIAGGVSAIATGKAMSCALAAGGSVRCWGFYTVDCTGGDFIIGGPLVCSSTLHGTPEEFATYAGSRRLAMGPSSDYICAINAAGGVNCGSAVLALPAEGYSAVSVGYYEACGIAGAGGVTCWTGWQWPTAMRARQVQGVAGPASAIAVGERHSCAIDGNGGVVCWGRNAEGQLGNGSTRDSSTAVPVNSLASGARAIATGMDHSCAVTASGRVRCWGSNMYGQLGIENAQVAYQSVPTAVLVDLSAINYTALWWNPAEPGWGVNLSHQSQTIFATLFTYAGDGNPLWLVASNLALQSNGEYRGTLYRVAGPPFRQVPWGPVSVAEVGGMALAFDDAGKGRLSYTYANVTVDKPIERQVFASPVPTCLAGTGSRASLTNYQDLWWNPAESGWGLNIAHQGDILFATLFTYADGGRDLWLVASRMDRQPDGSYSGTLYRTTGPAFDAQPWRPVTTAAVGTITLRFASGESGTLDYTVSGVRVTKSIVRQVFRDTVPFCR